MSVIAHNDQQPPDARGAGYIYKDGLQFNDLNKSTTLDPYEDWRLLVHERVDDLL